MRPVLEIFKMAGAFPDSPRTSIYVIRLLWLVKWYMDTLYYSYISPSYPVYSEIFYHCNMRSLWQGYDPNMWHFALHIVSFASQ